MGENESKTARRGGKYLCMSESVSLSDLCYVNCSKNGGETCRMTQPARTSRTPSIPPSCPGNKLSPLEANTGAMGSLMDALKAINSESG